MRIDVLTLFPKMFDYILGESILKRAQDKGIVECHIHNLRKWAKDRRGTVDDRPYGGGPGMVLKPEPVFEAVESIKEEVQGKGYDTSIILLTPQGSRYDQNFAKRLSELRHLILICGHYEGIDERVREYLSTEAISIGDYVLTCGELPSMLLMDSIIRLLPGVLGDEDSINFESFADNLLEYPHYTRPPDYMGMKVPGILLSGDHKAIEKWKSEQSIERTKRTRPDLLK